MEHNWIASSSIGTDLLSLVGVEKINPPDHSRYNAAPSLEALKRWEHGSPMHHVVAKRREREVPLVLAFGDLVLHQECPPRLMPFEGIVGLMKIEFIDKSGPCAWPSQNARGVWQAVLPSG